MSYTSFVDGQQIHKKIKKACLLQSHSEHVMITDYYVGLHTHGSKEIKLDTAMYSHNLIISG